MDRLWLMIWDLIKGKEEAKYLLAIVCVAILLYQGHIWGNEHLVTYKVLNVYKEQIQTEQDAQNKEQKKQDYKFSKMFKEVQKALATSELSKLYDIADSRGGFLTERQKGRIIELQKTIEDLNAEIKSLTIDENLLR